MNFLVFFGVQTICCLLYHFVETFLEVSIWLTTFALCKQQDTLDPPEDCFRIRMVITLLETCGHYFDRGSSKRKLDRFLIHFQRYILCKGALPLDIEFDLQVSIADMYSHLLIRLAFQFRCRNPLLIFFSNLLQTLLHCSKEYKVYCIR